MLSDTDRETMAVILSSLPDSTVISYEMGGQICEVRLTEYFSSDEAGKQIAVTWPWHRRAVSLFSRSSVTGNERHAGVRINGVASWRTRCVGSPPGSDDLVTFYSSDWMSDPVPVLQYAGATTLSVYVEHAKPGRSY